MQKSVFTPHYKHLRQRLVELRKAAGLNQRQLAGRVRREHSFIAKVELGERRVDLYEFYELCKSCRADPERVASELIRRFKEIDRSEPGDGAEGGSRKGRAPTRR